MADRGSDGAWRWTVLLVASGAAGLGYEALWMRRLGLILGGSATASAFTIGVFMGGLAVGGALSGRLARGRSVVRAYAALEVFAACWALLVPTILATTRPLAVELPALRWAVAALVLIPPTIALGATWPLLAREAGAALAARLYAANTAGGVVGVLTTTFLALPALGVRGAELVCAGLGVTAAAIALTGGPPLPGPDDAPKPVGRPIPAGRVVLASTASGFAALGLQLAWMRLTAVALGATVQTFGLVLATFLATMAIGAWVGRTWPRDPVRGLELGLVALGVLALGGAVAWGLLPYGTALLYAVGGPELLTPGSAALAAIAMGGAPAASGLAFACAVRALDRRLDRAAGWLYAGNTLGSIAGALLGGLWAVPALELRGAVILFAFASAVGAWVVRGRARLAVPVGALALLVPSWDARLYAVGVHLRISDFADPSPREIRRFADEGWELVSYDHGPTGAVAVGRSSRTGNVWLSINGKVDASTGADMPTQVLSGDLPVAIARDPRDVLVVGLASGVTAGAVLKAPVDALTVIELEPAVVAASRAFDHVNGRPLDDPRTRLVVEDARAWLQRAGDPYDVIVSEPSNPWITGVSSLFTLEYWTAARARLRPGGVMCQWVQLYGMGPDELRGIVRTFATVFPDTWLFETIPGSDVLLIGVVDGGPLPPDLPLQPTLGPEGVARLGGTGWLNTDDRPRVEWAAPRWLHYDTAPGNAALIEEVAASTTD